MRLRILARPSGTIDGISLDQFSVGTVYDVGTQIGCVLLAREWGEFVADDGGAAAPPPHELTLLKPLVLIVDDDGDVRRLAETLLTAHGYHVVLAADGSEGIQRLRDHCPDLVILDLNMPVMDGWDFRARQQAAADARAATAAPVVVMSAAEDAPAQASRLGAVAVVSKPFDPDALVDAVTAVVGTPASVRHMRAR